MEWPGLTEFNLELAFPTDKGGSAYVEAIATWKVSGRPDQLERRGKTAIPIRRNSGMIDDAILGKAERKMYAAVLNKLSSFVIPDGEIDADAIDVNSRQVNTPRRSSLNDYADPATDERKPAFDPQGQSEAVDGFRSNLEIARDNGEVAKVQKEAAEWAKSGRLSPESLGMVNTLANQRRSAIRKNNGKLFDSQHSATEGGL
jgi:hypothetical protein